jgi:hypothetical protein
MQSDKLGKSPTTGRLERERPPAILFSCHTSPLSSLATTDKSSAQCQYDFGASGVPAWREASQNPNHGRDHDTGHRQIPRRLKGDCYRFGSNGQMAHCQHDHRRADTDHPTGDAQKRALAEDQSKHTRTGKSKRLKHRVLFDAILYGHDSCCRYERKDKSNASVAEVMGEANQLR